MSQQTPERSFEIGRRIDIDAIPPVEEHTTYVSAGALEFGIEYRELDDDILAALYDPETRANSKVVELQEGVEDQGLSVHVFDAATRTERLRFDCFEANPHYHYMCSNGEQIVVAFDSAAHGPMLPWLIEALRSGQVRHMLTYAGLRELADRVEQEDVIVALADIETRVAPFMPGAATDTAGGTSHDG